MLDFGDDETIIKEKLNEIFIAILEQSQTDDGLKKLIVQVNSLLDSARPIDLSNLQIIYQDNNYSLIDLLHLITGNPLGNLFLPQFDTWVKDDKLVLAGYEPAIEKRYQEIPQELMEADIIEPKKVKKPYIQKDNQELLGYLRNEFEGQAIGLAGPKSIYAWKFKSGQLPIEKNQDDGNEINIFFLGTSTPPLFGIHNVDVCETGHIICQAALQKAQKGKPTLLVKGIATIDMDSQFPLAALENPSIQGVSSTTMEGFGKTYTTVKGTGADTRMIVTMEQYFVPNLLKMISNKPLAQRDTLTINIAGHSRGAITTFIAADCIDKFINTIVNGKEGTDYDVHLIARNCQLPEEEVKRAIQDIKQNQEKIKMKVCALDPVEGARSMAQWDHFITWREGKYIPKINVPISGLKRPIECSYSEMPSRLSDALIFLATDERRSGFRPTIPSFSKETNITYKQAHGKHGTLTGNFGNDAVQGQFFFKTFESDEKLQDAVLGIFDETLVTMNHFLNKYTELPPFPRNTLRRIFNQVEYANTKRLLIDALKSISHDPFEVDVLEEDILVKKVEQLMQENPRFNIAFYDSLYHDAQNAIIHQKSKLPDLKKEWRHDTNVAALVDRDAWHTQRKTYIRGYKVQGDVSWKEFPLEEIAPTRLPETVYYDTHVKIADMKLSNSLVGELFSNFYKIKVKIDFIANSPNLSQEEKQRAIFDEEFDNFIILLSNPELDTKIVRDMMSELMIDLDARYRLFSPVAILDKFRKVKVDNFDLLTSCAQIQLASLQKFIHSNGISNLSLEETHTLVEYVSDLQDRLQSRKEIDLAASNLNREKYDDIVFHFSNETFNQHQQNLNELKAALELKAELDQYITALEVYIEGKRKITGQSTILVEQLLKSLKEIHANLQKNPSADSRRDMQELLNKYINEKGFQGIGSKWIQSEPASVSCIKMVEKQIEENKLLKEVKRMESESEKFVNEDLETYIRALTDHISSYRWTTPDPSASKLLDELKNLRAASKPLNQKVEEMNKLINKYVTESPLTMLRSYTGPVQTLLDTTKSIQKSRMMEATKRLGDASRFNK